MPISYLGLLGAPGEDNELGLVHLEPCNIYLQTLHTLVVAAMVNSDSDCGGELHGNACLLQVESSMPAGPKNWSKGIA